MTQHTLSMETSILIPTNNMSRHVNEINKLDEFKHHRGAILYHPKIIKKLLAKHEALLAVQY
ncbi:hypothetical protein ACIGHE_10920 [Staphylococcus pasteuri]|uniref:hypothetical protein n=1 Tax=Staphylococcus TaxID=1279 RepID=UPI0008A3DE60|nr:MULTISPECIES: hypothetical protein [Staphylococcus]OFV12969.1 hypothetical protein HMPREF3125_01585 [Staphylococcus sp. HMSC13A10]